ncbi:T9SS type A sorting domain-containing protein [Bacteroidota bacterium]
MGKVGITGEPVQIPDRLGGGTTSFTLSGDPSTGSGWVDGIEWTPGDRNMNMSSGPFNMMPGDTQEVVYAQMAFGADDGVDRLGAVQLLKFYSKYVQMIYNGMGIVELPETSPVINSYSADREIILYWGSSIENVDKIENHNSFFSFQGYNIYQVPNEDSEISDGIKIAAYDLKDGIDTIYDEEFDLSSQRIVTITKHEGRDTGIDRYIKLDVDYLRDQPFNNGTNYYFIVEPYYYNPDGLLSPRTIETHSEVIKVMPHSADPGIRFEFEFGDKIPVHSASGNVSDVVDVMVIDPSQLTGHDYEITFHESTKQLLWNLEDVTSGEIKLSDQTNITGTDEYYIVDGFMIIITQDTSNQQTSNQLTSDDVFTFTTPGVIDDEELAKFDVEKINVFPNPYYGGHSNELSQYQNYVMFNHLPKRATFRIFNLAGHLVRTLHKDDGTQFYLWDLQNENRLLAPSGLYIIYIEMPDLQKVKVLKLAIVQRQVVPSNF